MEKSQLSNDKLITLQSGKIMLTICQKLVKELEMKRFIVLFLLIGSFAFINANGLKITDKSESVHHYFSLPSSEKAFIFQSVKHFGSDSKDKKVDSFALKFIISGSVDAGCGLILWIIGAALMGYGWSVDVSDNSAAGSLLALGLYAGGAVLFVIGMLAFLSGAAILTLGILYMTGVLSTGKKSKVSMFINSSSIEGSSNVKSGLSIKL